MTQKPSPVALLGRSFSMESQHTRYRTYKDTVETAKKSGLLDAGDPRLGVTEEMVAAEKRLFPSDAKEKAERILTGMAPASNGEGPLPFPSRDDAQETNPGPAGLLAAHDSLFFGKNHADPKMGRAGRLAAQMEAAALSLHADNPNDPRVLPLLAIGGALHDNGGRAVLYEDYQHARGSVLIMSANTKGDPVDITKDLRDHGILSRNDIRCKISNADVESAKDTSKETLALVNPLPRPKAPSDATKDEPLSLLAFKARLAESAILRHQEHSPSPPSDRPSFLEVMTAAYAIQRKSLAADSQQGTERGIPVGRLDGGKHKKRSYADETR